MKGIKKNSTIKETKANQQYISNSIINQQDIPHKRERGIKEPLTNRESEIMNLISTGKPNKAIADHLDISVHTVKNHNKKIFTKLGVSSRSEAIIKFNKY